MAQVDSLDALEVVTPCPMLWSEMQGDERVRFCDRCRKNVYNLEAMSRSDALAVIGRAEGQACVRLSRRPDGTVTTGDCRTRLRQARRRGLLAFAVMLLVVLPGQLLAQAFGLHTLAALLRPKPAPSVEVDPAPRTMGLGRMRRIPKSESVVLQRKLDEEVMLGRIGRAPASFGRRPLK
jgi:hypothetical protein